MWRNEQCHSVDLASSYSLQMADQGEKIPQVPACENLQPAQAVAVAQPPPLPLLQNQEEPANPNPRQNAAAGEVTLAVCSAFGFLVSSTCSCILYLRCSFTFSLKAFTNFVRPQFCFRYSWPWHLVEATQLKERYLNGCVRILTKDANVS